MRAQLGKAMPIALELAGDLTIRGIDAAHGLLVDGFKQDGDVLVSIAADSVADLSFVQLIQAGRRTALAGGRGFSLAAPAAGTLLETLGRGGFLEAPDDRAFWLLESGN